MRILITLLSILLYTKTHAQKVSREYALYADSAEQYYKKRNFKQAIPKFQKAFLMNKGMATVLHRYELASSWAILDQADSAFVQLKRIVEKGNFAGYDLISKDINFINLHNDKRWGPLLDKIITNGENSGKF